MDFTMLNIPAAGIYNSLKDSGNCTHNKPTDSNTFKIELPLKFERKSRGRIKEAVPPDIITCTKPGQKIACSSSYKCYYLYIVTHDEALYDTLIKLPDKIKITDYEHYCNLFDELFILFDADDEKKSIMLQSIVLKLIYNLNKAKCLNASDHKHNAVVKKLVDYISKNLTADLSLEKIARITTFSPTHLHKIFKSCIGKNLQSYIEDLRLSKAKHLLLTTELTLSEIALRCGFSSQSYFSYVFKKRTEMTPKKYVQTNNDNFHMDTPDTSD